MLVISRMKILIAEDDKDSRELLSWLLQKLGYQVVATENGKEAWEAYRVGMFRLVISDLLMPDIDGLELMRRIRAQKQAKYTYIILITALIGKKDYLEGMEAGADDFVTKPSIRMSSRQDCVLPSESSHSRHKLPLLTKPLKRVQASLEAGFGHIRHPRTP